MHSAGQALLRRFIATRGAAKCPQVGGSCGSPPSKKCVGVQCNFMDPSIFLRQLLIDNLCAGQAPLLQCLLVRKSDLSCTFKTAILSFPKAPQSFCQDTHMPF